MFWNAIVEGVLEAVATMIAVAAVGGVIFLFGKVAKGGVSIGPDKITMQYLSWFRGIGLLSLTIGAASGAVYVAGLLGVQQNEKAHWVLFGFTLFFGGLGGLLTVEVFRRKVVLTESGITSTGWFQTVGEIPWSECESVKCRFTMGDYLVRARGVKIKVSHYLDGLECFTETCKMHLAPEVYGDEFLKPINRPM